MMSKTNQWESDLLSLLFVNTAVTLVGDAGGLQPSGAAGSLYISLHTGDPGEGGSQTTSETAYGSYARVAVARTVGGWTVGTGTVSNAAGVTFPTCSGGSSTVSYFGVGTDPSGAGKLLYRGSLTAPIAITAGVTPFFATGDLTVTEE
jgi:hypothetical protein